VPKAYDKVDEALMDKPIDKIKTVAEVKKDPYNLPPGFVWADVDINDKEQAKEVYELLT
jgi:glycylpeptide N-tetradecanoyltransferase